MYIKMNKLTGKRSSFCLMMVVLTTMGTLTGCSPALLLSFLVHPSLTGFYVQLWGA
jgi:hypothetical protein